MASTGRQAWEKHFKGKGNIKTTMKKPSILYDLSGANVGRIDAGQAVTILETKNYSDRVPIEYGKQTFFVTFNNIQKPKSKLVSGIKLKPQDFAFFTQETWNATDLAKKLIDEVEEREDLDPTLKTYLTTITRYWGKIGTVSSSEISNLVMPDRGLNEIKKDYGEMLGAIACVKHKILKDNNIKIPSTAKINFPLRGNEPIVDYYIIVANTKHSISAKSGSTTNTLKASDIIQLLKDKKQYDKWKNKAVTKLMALVADTPTAQFPFQAINLVAEKKILSKQALEEVKNFKMSKFNTKDYDQSNFQKLIDLIKISGNPSKPTIGQLFYFTEKYIIDTANTKNKYDPSDIFEAATVGSVIYVKYDIGSSNKQGTFTIMIPEPNKDKTKKGLKWRSKNSQNRASDKLGIQP